MTSPISGRPDNDRPAGFTLVELLVVVGIIALLLGILVPTVSKALTQAKKTRIASSLQAISTALEAYKADFGDYPRLEAKPLIATGGSGPIGSAILGTQLLTRALIAPDGIGQYTFPDDGKAGTAFRTKTAGRTYGPYVASDTFKISDGTDTYKTVLGQTLPPGCLLDGYGNPILYYPAALSRNNLFGYVDARPNYAVLPTALYTSTDNDMSAVIANYPFHVVTGDDGAGMMRIMLGDWDGSGGAMQPDETSLYTGPFLLWSAGPDGLFGPVDSNGAPLTALPANTTEGKQAAGRSDDVTNFPR